MEKRALVAVAISLLFLIVWSRFFAPPPPPPPDPVAPDVTVASPAAAELLAAEPVDDIALADPIAAELEAETVVRTDLYEVTLTNRGGRVLSWKLLAYTNGDGDPVELVPPEARETGRLPLSVFVPGRADLEDRADQGLFEVVREPLPAGDGERVRMRYADASGLAVEKTLEFRAASYFLDVTISLRDGAAGVPAWLMWGPGFGETADTSRASSGSFFRVGGAVINRDGDVDRFAKDKYEVPTSLDGQAPLLWAGMETTYFAAVMIPDTPVQRAVLLPKEYRRAPPPGTEGDEEVEVFLGIALDPGTTGGPSHYTLFVGPKDFHLLRAYGHDLVSVINFGWPVIRQIAQGMFLALTWIYGYVGNYGVAIIILTFVIRLAFFPIMYRTQIKMRNMQRKTKKIQPKMKAIKDRHRKTKSDMASRQKMNDEIMGLYRKEGINPLGGLGGCLPMFIQLPFLYGFYQLLRETIELRQAPFMGWITDLSLPDPIWITPLLMGLSMLVQTKISMANVADPNQRRMMTMMSVVFTVFFLNMPSGLVLYWLFSNLLGIGQQYLVNRRADHEAEAETPPKPQKSKNSRKSQKQERARAATR